MTGYGQKSGIEVVFWNQTKGILNIDILCLTIQGIVSVLLTGQKLGLFDVYPSHKKRFIEFHT